MAGGFEALAQMAWWLQGGHQQQPLVQPLPAEIRAAPVPKAGPDAAAVKAAQPKPAAAAKPEPKEKLAKQPERAAKQEKPVAAAAGKPAAQGAAVVASSGERFAAPKNYFFCLMVPSAPTSASAT